MYCGNKYFNVAKVVRKRPLKPTVYMNFYIELQIYIILYKTITIQLMVGGTGYNNTYTIIVT